MVRFHFSGDQITLIPFFPFSHVISWNLFFVLSCLEFDCFRKILLGRVARVFFSGVLCIVLLNIVFYSLYPRIVTSLNMYSVDTNSAYHGPGGPDIMTSLPATKREDPKSF